MSEAELQKQTLRFSGKGLIGGEPSGETFKARTELWGKRGGRQVVASGEPSFSPMGRGCSAVWMAPQGAPAWMPGWGCYRPIGVFGSYPTLAGGEACLAFQVSPRQLHATEAAPEEQVGVRLLP